ncbi:MAG: aspartate kinase [Flavobacteriales bacterium]|nr:MAG: aspartate kinase [Flavobacteriales bacterium]
MEIYKFGGVSIKDAEGVRRIAKIVQDTEFTKGIIVISAMGKMTNAFEGLIAAYLNKDSHLAELLKEIENYHYQIAKSLFKELTHPVFSKIRGNFEQIRAFIQQNKSDDYNFVYDQMVSVAELVSSKIVSAYFNQINLANTWLDVRNCIRTNSQYREALVDWEYTKKRIQKLIDNNQLYITQGFIAQGVDGATTTLGREGSDYTGAVFAYCLNARSQTIWKDVDGVLNADPRKFKNPVLLNRISYEEAIEMAFYGASVIHPKTIQPLQQKSIPLKVKSFRNPKNEGTTICKGIPISPDIPCFILKEKQILLSLSSLDFAFIVERNISYIFGLLHRYKIKVNLIQNSAISFLICLEDKYHNFDFLIRQLDTHFNISYEKDLRLYTIRHFSDEAVKKIEALGKVLFKQSSTKTVQLVIR